MVGLVVVSHSRRAAEGIAEVAGEMGGETAIEPVGGDGQSGFGTVADDIADGPVLEGAVNAAVAATSPNATLDSVREQAEAARDIDKL